MSLRRARACVSGMAEVLETELHSAPPQLSSLRDASSPPLASHSLVEDALEV
eukprot:CAMPEP_0197552686 /NCGR_PEP_ID=MMETSP1320-20131121/6676_1 /TAXON_ID=91990 /ORGANISM="Bolidomonas sp., Strain RCC2347" /LENGTH=51 /DNA_ID=CAMNT_0043113323 /DNA_START=37 /DNA_END=188 /DNA_ORIENTATION=+